LSVQHDQPAPVVAVEDDIVGQQNTYFLAIPRPQHCVADASGLWLNSDLDRKGMIAFGEVLGQEYLRRRDHHNSSIKPSSRRLGEGMANQWPASEEQEFLG
jgi:hypothetical protein